MERGIDEGLVKELSDGTKESMLILQTLVSGSDEQIEALNQALAGVDEGRQRASDAIAGIQVDWDTKMGELQANAYADGQYVSEGFAQGIESQKSRLEDAIRYVSNAARNQFLTTWEINSPSRVAADMARWIPLGAAEGVESETTAFISAVKKMYDVSSSYTLPAVRSPYLPDYPAIVGSEKSVSIHLGGVQISLAAPQNTDLEALARLVGDTINEEAIRLAVAYG